MRFKSSRMETQLPSEVQVTVTPPGVFPAGRKRPKIGEGGRNRKQTFPKALLHALGSEMCVYHSLAVLIWPWVNPSVGTRG